MRMIHPEQVLIAVAKRILENISQHSPPELQDRLDKHLVHQRSHRMEHYFTSSLSHAFHALAQNPHLEFVVRCTTSLSFVYESVAF